MTSFDPGNLGQTPAEEPTKKSVTKKDVADAIAALQPAKPAELSAGDKERARRKNVLTAKVQSFTNELQVIGVQDGNPADAIAVFKALGTVAKKGSAAIDSLTDAKLGTAEPKAPRVTKPKVEEDTVEKQRIEEVVSSSGQQIPVPEDNEADRESRQAARLDAAAGERGATDPNLNDGF